VNIQQCTLALTAAADNAAAAATVTSLSVFLAPPDSSDDAGLLPAEPSTAYAYSCIQQFVSLGKNSSYFYDK